MKNLLLIFVLFGFLFIGQEDAFAQKKSKKIESYEIDYQRWDAEYCRDSYGNIQTNCIDRIKLTFTNNSNFHVSTIVVNVKIVNSEGTTLYKKKHTCSVDLDPFETAACKQFKLSEKVHHSYNFDEYNTFSVYVEVLSVK